MIDRNIALQTMQRISQMNANYWLQMLHYLSNDKKNTLERLLFSILPEQEAAAAVAATQYRGHSRCNV